MNIIMTMTDYYCDGFMVRQFIDMIMGHSYI